MNRKNFMHLIVGLLVVLISLQAIGVYLSLEKKEQIIKDEFVGLNNNDFVQVAQKTTPSIVFIAANGKSGSGVIVRNDGIIVTNNHVIDKSENITVRLLDKRIFRAELIGGDEKADIAVIKINADNLTSLNFADSDKVEVGQPVIALGNPFGYDFTVTTGIISAKHRERGPTDYKDFIQTDASINPGNSGGPLVDLKGDIVGINTFIVTDEKTGELGFAIPSNLVKDLTEQLLEFGKVERGYMGLVVRDVVDINVQGEGKILEGSLIEDVLEKGPADKAGIKKGDFIVKIDNSTIENSNVLRNLIASYKPGERVLVTVDRNGTLMDIELKLGTAP